MEWKEVGGWEWKMVKGERDVCLVGICGVRIESEDKRDIVRMYKK